VAVVRHSFGRWVRTAAWSLAGCTVLILIAAMVLVGLNAKPMGPSKIAFDVAVGLAVVVYAGVGRLIASRVPGNAIGWLLGLMGLSLGASVLAEQYALYGLATAPGSLPAARLAGWASDLLASLTVLLLFFVVLLFPDGGSRRAGGGRCSGPSGWSGRARWPSSCRSAS
jgi:hypothetical protein